MNKRKPLFFSNTGKIALLVILLNMVMGTK